MMSDRLCDADAMSPEILESHIKAMRESGMDENQIYQSLHGIIPDRNQYHHAGDSDDKGNVYIQGVGFVREWEPRIPIKDGE
jgi:hypothetical protein